MPMELLSPIPRGKKYLTFSFSSILGMSAPHSFSIETMICQKDCPLIFEMDCPTQSQNSSDASNMKPFGSNITWPFSKLGVFTISYFYNEVIILATNLLEKWSSKFIFETGFFGTNHALYEPCQQS